MSLLSLQQGNLRKFNEIFKKDMFYGNIKSHKKAAFNTLSLSRNHIFGKRVALGGGGGGGGGGVGRRCQVEPHPSLFRVNLSEVDYRTSWATFQPKFEK